MPLMFRHTRRPFIIFRWSSWFSSVHVSVIPVNWIHLWSWSAWYFHGGMPAYIASYITCSMLMLITGKTPLTVWNEIKPWHAKWAQTRRTCGIISLSLNAWSLAYAYHISLCTQFILKRTTEYKYVCRSLLATALVVMYKFAEKRRVHICTLFCSIRTKTAYCFLRNHLAYTGTPSTALTRSVVLRAERTRARLPHSIQWKTWFN